MNSNEIWRGLIAPLESIDLNKAIEDLGFKVIGRCKDCRFFSMESSSIVNYHGECSNQKVLGSDDDMTDGIHEWAALEASVGPEFGCIHWEGKGPNG